MPPANSGWEIVTEHGAVGDGQTDCTQAINAIPIANKHAVGTVFFPDGEYLVGDTIFLGGNTVSKRWVLVGQSREKTVIRLKDNCPGFQDPKNPRAVISFVNPSPKGSSTGQAFGNG